MSKNKEKESCQNWTNQNKFRLGDLFSNIFLLVETVTFTFKVLKVKADQCGKSFDTDWKCTVAIMKYSKSYIEILNNIESFKHEFISKQI